MTDRTDNFNRTDGLIGTPSDAGSAWGIEAGEAWEVLSNKGYCSSTGIQTTCHLESSVSDGYVQVTISTFGTDCGVCFRKTDNDNVLLLLATLGVGFRLFKRVASSFTQIGSTDTASPANGDVLKATFNSSNNLAGFVNGGALSGPSGTDSFNSTATKHGMRIHSDIVTRFDDFSFVGSGGGGGSVGHRVIGGWGGRTIGD